MNRYGAQLMTHWKRERQPEFAELTDPEAYFSQMGEDIAEEIERLHRTLAGKGPQGEGYLARVGRLRTARSEAESTVLRTYLLESPRSQQSTQVESE